MASITLRPTSESRHERVGVDWWMLISALVLVLIGVGAIYSSTQGTSTIFAKKQVFNILLGLVPAGIFAIAHPRFWGRYVNWIYVFNLLALAAVLLFGSTTKGAERWIEVGPIRLQPSEFSKILIVLTMSTFYSVRQDKIKQFSTFVLGLLHVAVPAVLIYAQPHLGSTILVVFLWVALSLVAGIPPKFMFAFLIPTLLLAGLVIGSPKVRHMVLKPYQVERVETLLGISKDSQDAKDRRLQVERAEESFGNGGLAGTGFLKGELKSRVPEQHTDFIFSLIGEEFGFIGSVFVLMIFAVLFYRIWIGMLNAADFYYQMIMAGILTILTFHLIVNLGMVLQILPVVGLWCPFLSSGGTAIWLCMSLIGLAINIRARERAVLF